MKPRKTAPKIPSVEQLGSELMDSFGDKIKLGSKIRFLEESWAKELAAFGIDLNPKVASKENEFLGPMSWVSVRRIYSLLYRGRYFNRDMTLPVPGGIGSSKRILDLPCTVLGEFGIKDMRAASIPKDRVFMVNGKLEVKRSPRGRRSGLLKEEFQVQTNDIRKVVHLLRFEKRPRKTRAGQQFLSRSAVVYYGSLVDLVLAAYAAHQLKERQSQNADKIIGKLKNKGVRYEIICSILRTVFLERYNCQFDWSARELRKEFDNDAQRSARFRTGIYRDLSSREQAALLDVEKNLKAVAETRAVGNDAEKVRMDFFAQSYGLYWLVRDLAFPHIK